MTILSSGPTKSLFEADETAWLEQTADLLRGGRWEEIDADTLAGYLADMAGRDRREVESRLAVLMTHRLKWIHQADHRTGSWRATIIEQRQELEGLIGRGVLRNHANSVLSRVYRRAVERAAAETGLPPTHFPLNPPFTLDELLLPLPADPPAT